MDVFHYLGEWVVAVVEHWEGYVFTGVIGFVLELFKRFRDWEPRKKVLLGIVILGFISSIFSTWKDERLKAEDAEQRLRYSGVAVHLTPGVPGVVPQSLGSSDILPIDRVVKLGQPWTVSGSAPARHERDRAYCYISDDHEEATQDRLIEASIQKWEADPIRLTKEGRDVTTPMLFGEFCASDVMVDQKLLDGVRFNHKFLFVIGVARFSDVLGEHGSHSCQWMESYPSLNNNVILGKWNGCHKYETQIDMAGK